MGFRLFQRQCLRSRGSSFRSVSYELLNAHIRFIEISRNSIWVLTSLQRKRNCKKWKFLNTCGNDTTYEMRLFLCRIGAMIVNTREATIFFEFSNRKIIICFMIRWMFSPWILEEKNAIFIRTLSSHITAHRMRIISEKTSSIRPLFFFHIIFVFWCIFFFI